MVRAHIPTPPSRSASWLKAGITPLAGEFITAALIIVGGGWLTALASLR